jgi:hypothetical protein
MLKTTTFILTPFLILVLGATNNAFNEYSDVLINLVHLTTPRLNGLPSPFSYGVHTFYSVIDRNPIRLATKKVPGIYCWVNNVTGNCYVGKANNLYLRISNYFQSNHILTHMGTSLICRAIHKHNITSFSLVILEVNPANLAAAEQHWIDLLHPEYNVITNVLVDYDPATRKPDRFGANNSFFGRQHTDATKKILSESALKRPTPNNPGFEFIITDTVNGTSQQYTSIRTGVKAMGWNQPNVMRHLRTNAAKLYLKRYLLQVLRDK